MQYKIQMLIKFIAILINLKTYYVLKMIFFAKKCFNFFDSNCFSTLISIILLNKAEFSKKICVFSENLGRVEFRKVQKKCHILFDWPISACCSTKELGVDKAKTVKQS